MQVVESDFAVGDVERGIKLLHGLTVGGTIGEMNLSLAVRIGESTACLNEEISLAGDGIVISGEGLEVGQVGVVDVGAEVEKAVSREMALLERSGGVKYHDRVVTA